MNDVLNSVARAESVLMTRVEAVWVDIDVRNSVAVSAKVSIIVAMFVMVRYEVNRSVTSSEAV